MAASIDHGFVPGGVKLTQVSLKYRITPAIGASPACVANSIGTAASRHELDSVWILDRHFRQFQVKGKLIKKSGA